MERQEAIEVIKKNWPHSGYTMLREALETLIPELKESKDEKMRKDLIKFVLQYGDSHYSQIDKESAISWLEKQGEQKPSWSEEDEIGYNDVLFAIGKARLVAKDENDMGNLWFAENWLKSLKRNRVVKIEKQDVRILKDNSTSELNESEDEEIRKWIINEIKIKHHNLDEDSVDFVDKAITWLEKQGEQKRLDYPYVTGWRENRPDNKPQIKHSVLMLTTHGVAEGEWLGEEWCQYRWSGKVKDTDVLYWLHLSDLESLEKEGNSNSISPEEMNKSICRGIASSLTKYLDDNRYAGAMNMSNMECEDLEKSILDSNWEKVYRYMRKKLEKQGGQKSYWSEEDENLFNNLVYLIENSNTGKATQKGFITFITKLKSLLKSFKPQWKPSEEQMQTLNNFLTFGGTTWRQDTGVLSSLYEDLQKLLKE